MTLISKRKEPGEIVAASRAEKFRNQVRDPFPDFELCLFKRPAVLLILGRRPLSDPSHRRWTDLQTGSGTRGKILPSQNSGLAGIHAQISR